MGGGRLLGAWLTALAAVAAAPRYHMRPDACTALGLAVLLVWLCDYKAGRRQTLWGLVPLGLVWANLHGGILTGVAALGAFIGAEVVQWIVQSRGKPAEPAQGDGGRLTHLLLAGAAFAVTSFMTPNTWRLHAWSFGGGLGGLTQEVVEYMPLWLSYHIRWVPNLTWGVLMLSVLVLLLRPRGRAPLAAWVLLLMFAVWAAKMARHVWPAGLVALGAANLTLAARPVEAVQRQSKRWAAALACGAVLAVMVVGVWDRWVRMAWRGDQVGIGRNVELLPLGAVRWLLAQRPPGHLFNNYGDSYYLAFSLYPTYRLFIDGFTDYPPEIFRAQDTITETRNPTGMLDIAGVGIVVIGPDACVYWEFARRLEAKGEWVGVYGDGVSTVYLRNKPEYAPLIEQWGYKALLLAEARPRPAADAASVTSEMERVRREGVESAGLHAFLGLLSERRGDLGQAEKEYRTAASMSGSAIAPLRLGVLAKRRGEEAEAERWLRRARGAIPAPLLEDFTREDAAFR